MSTHHGTLTLRVVYDTSAYEDKGLAERDILNLLAHVATAAAGDGRLSGETDLIVDAWDYDFEVEAIR